VSGLTCKYSTLTEIICWGQTLQLILPQNQQQRKKLNKIDYWMAERRPNWTLPAAAAASTRARTTPERDRLIRGQCYKTFFCSLLTNFYSKLGCLSLASLSNLAYIFANSRCSALGWATSRKPVTTKIRLGYYVFDKDEHSNLLIQGVNIVKNNCITLIVLVNSIKLISVSLMHKTDMLVCIMNESKARILHHKGAR